MRTDRRTTVAGLVAIGIAAVLLFDLFGVRSAVGSWVRVADPASGPPAAMAAAVSDRAGTVESLETALATDPTLSLALLAVGLGVGVIAGSTAAFLQQRRRLQRGERDG
ncbi:hypothetical protein [Salinarchaeum laminariae]|uniref:hypothetical protein n=1 Tax=Salinarchaeum laminariae TaxID=869888 RepID=UPI0020BEFD56|nr:hypothetical protein [Salinarchaeum laminariae]